jgi:hypothetical protein
MGPTISMHACNLELLASLNQPSPSLAHRLHAIADRLVHYVPFAQREHRVSAHIPARLAARRCCRSCCWGPGSGAPDHAIINKLCPQKMQKRSGVKGGSDLGEGEGSGLCPSTHRRNTSPLPKIDMVKEAVYFLFGGDLHHAESYLNTRGGIGGKNWPRSLGNWGPVSPQSTQ